MQTFMTQGMITVMAICICVDGKLLVRPRNTVAVVGHLTYFNCSTNETDGKIQWLKGDEHIYAGDKILNLDVNRFSVELDIKTGSCNLVIRNVTKEDAGSYTCKDVKNIEDSSVAALSILDSSPSCQSNVKSHGLLGPNDCSIVPEVLNLSCSVTYHGNTPPTLQWKSVNGHTTAITSGEPCKIFSNDTTKGGKVVCYLTVNVELYLHNSSLVCQTNSAANEQYSCTSDPIKVLYAFDSFNVIEKTVDETVKCFANSTAQCNYKWLLNDEVIGNGSPTVTLQRPGFHRCEAKCNMRGSQCSVTGMLVQANTGSEPKAGAETSSILAIVFGVLFLLSLASIICLLLYLHRYKKKRRRIKEEIIELGNQNDVSKSPPTDVQGVSEASPLLQSDVEKLQSELVAKNSELALKSNELEDKQKELDDKEKRLDSRQKDRDGKEKELDDKQKKLDSKQKELDDKEKTLDDRQKKLDRKQKDLDGKEKELDDRQKKLGDKQEQLGGKQKELDDKPKGLDGKHKELSGIQKELDDKQKEVGDIHKNLEENQNELEDSKGELRKKKEELAKQDADKVLIIGLSDGSRITKEVLKINLQNPSEMYHVEKVPVSIQEEATAAVYRNTVYVVGLGTFPDQIWKYESKSGWKRCTTLKEGRTRHCAAFVDEILYICGGFVEADENVLDDVEACNTADDRPMCKKVGKLVIPAQNSGNCVAYKKSLYIFGGMDKSDKPISDVQVYDTEQNTCHLLSNPMPDAYNLMRAVLWRESVILLGQRNCFIYNFSKDMWTLREDFKTSVVHFGLGLSNDRIYVIGGGRSITDAKGEDIWICRDDVRSVAIEEIIEEKSVQWKAHGRLPRPSLVYAFAVVREPTTQMKRARSLNTLQLQKPLFF